MSNYPPDVKESDIPGIDAQDQVDMDYVRREIRQELHDKVKHLSEQYDVPITAEIEENEVLGVYFQQPEPFRPIDLEPIGNDLKYYYVRMLGRIMVYLKTLVWQPPWIVDASVKHLIEQIKLADKRRDLNRVK